MRGDCVGVGKHLRCQSIHGAGEMRRVMVKTCKRLKLLGRMLEAYSVDLGLMIVMCCDNSARTGSASMTVHGVNLCMVGFMAKVRSGETGCEGTE